MNSDLQAALEREIQHLTEDDDAKRTREFDRDIRQNVRSWEERLASDPFTIRWLMLDACLARIDASERDWSSVIRAERLAWATEVCQRLLACENGYAMAGKLPRALHVISRLLGAREAERALRAVAEPAEQTLAAPQKNLALTSP